MADHIQLIILIGFATLTLLLAQSRELMRQVSRTAEEWHRMRNAMRGPHQLRKPHRDAADPADCKAIEADLDETAPEDTGRDR